MDDPTKGSLVIRPKPDAYKYKQGGTSESIVAMYPSKIIFDEKEGYEMTFDELKYPINCLLDPIALMAADRIKKSIKRELKLLASFPFIISVFLFAIFPRKKIINRWLDDFSEFVFLETKEFILEEPKLGRVARELHRAFSIGADKVLQQLVDAFCMIMDQDRPYRYRVQDILPLINKALLLENPAREIKHVINILIARDHARPWGQLGNLAYWAIRLYPDLRETIVAMLMEVDLVLIAMDTRDKYLSYRQTGYDYGGLSQEERETIHPTL